MPIDIISTAIFDGPQAIPGWDHLKVYVPAAAALGAVKWYFGGASNTWKRDLHGRVFIVTGGTSGLGAAATYELALRGAQVVLLCRLTSDPFTVDFVEDMRERTNNFMIYAEQCDLSSLHLVRLFATTWLDNLPPRRLDGVICCAAECLPPGKKRQLSHDGVETQIAVNYLAHFHLLTLLRPSLHVQPPDRDVRVVLVTCASQALATVDSRDLLWESRPYPATKPWQVYGTLKLMLGMFAKLFQRRLNEYVRPDKSPCNIRVSVVNPGIMRTASTRRFFSLGSILGLLIYVVLYPLWFLVFKSPLQGVQSVLFAILAPVLGAQDGGNLIQECRILTTARKEYYDYELQDEMYSQTEKAIEALEKLAAIERKKQEKASGIDKKKQREAKKKQEDIHEKPETEADLEYKLSMMRKSMGMPFAPEKASENAKLTGRRKQSAKKR